ncbi:hypothetical protein DPMN_097915 [Dreissena polymorpha]|uniref:Uncharacterized protein n=1 Tax=Dreissena polymorpha TaxID=45954 RepID=A0A9D4LCN0_DREPO|nr:hypothetical protein DPMN_097915 [Dreissena polymorpha]
MFPDWYGVLSTDRTVGVNTQKKDDRQKTKSRMYSNETIVDSVDNSVFIDEKDTVPAKQNSHAHKKINSPENRSCTCDKNKLGDTLQSELICLPVCAPTTLQNNPPKPNTNSQTRRGSSDEGVKHTRLPVPSSNTSGKPITRNNEQGVNYTYTACLQCLK